MAALHQEFEFDRLYLILGVMRDKDLAAIAAPFISITEFAWTVQAEHPRSRGAVEVAEQLGGFGIRAAPASSMGAAIQNTRERAGP